MLAAWLWLKVGKHMKRLSFVLGCALSKVMNILTSLFFTILNSAYILLFKVVHCRRSWRYCYSSWYFFLDCSHTQLDIPFVRLCVVEGLAKSGLSPSCKGKRRHRWCSLELIQVYFQAQFFFRLNLKVEERALLVINCAGNEGDTVEKIAGNIPKVMRTIELNWLISSILSHAFIHRIFDHHLELSNFFLSSYVSSILLASV